MSYITARDISHSVGGRALFDSVSLTVRPGERIGVIGANGSGKTTLMRILAGDLEPKGGTVLRHPDLRIGFLRQQPRFEAGASVRQVLERAVEEFDLLRDELVKLSHHVADADGEEQETLLARQAELMARIEAADAWSAEQRVEETAGRFGLHDLDANVDALSGGWRKRLALARMLLTQPDLLLLDEPTNHLDADTVDFLENILERYHGSVVLVTHDRYFLDRVAGRIVEVESARLFPYRGTYSEYLKEKARKLDLLVKQHERRLRLIKSEEAFLKQTPQGRRGKSEARIRELEALKKIPPPRVPRDVHLDLVADEWKGNALLNAVELSKSYGERTLFRNVSFALQRGERIGVIGPNGCGKTTLLRSLAGEIAPDDGYVEKPKAVELAYFDQTRSGLDPEETVYDAVNSASEYVTVGVQRKHIVGYLEDFLFTSDDLRRRIDSLSGGERARVALARLLLQGAQVLLLDEPTNDLDIPTTQVLESALTAFDGCSIIITHDRFFLDRIATSILAFEEDGAVTRYYGNYTLYRRLKAQKDRDAAEKASGKRSGNGGKTPTPKTFGYRQQEELKTVESDIERLEAEISEMDARFADPVYYEKTDPDTVAESAKAYDTRKAELETRLARWEELEELRMEEENNS